MVSYTEWTSADVRQWRLKSRYPFNFETLNNFRPTDIVLKIIPQCHSRILISTCNPAHFPSIIGKKCSDEIFPLHRIIFRFDTTILHCGSRFIATGSIFVLAYRKSNENLRTQMGLMKYYVDGVSIC